jgi:hypothetical protein
MPGQTESLVPMLSLRDVSEQVLKIKAEGLAPRRRPPAQRTQDTRARAPVRICENVSDRASEVDSGDPTIPYQPAMALLHSREARARPRCGPAVSQQRLARSDMIVMQGKVSALGEGEEGGKAACARRITCYR